MKFGGKSSCNESLGLVFALPGVSAGGLAVAPGGAAEAGERVSAGAGGAAASFLLGALAAFLSSRIWAAALGEAASAAGSVDGLARVVVSLGAGGGGVDPVSAGATGRGGAALLGATGGAALAPSSLGSTSSTLMASGLPSRSPR
jgi:hypothetical protein